VCWCLVCSCALLTIVWYKVYCKDNLGAATRIECVQVGVRTELQNIWGINELQGSAQAHEQDAQGGEKVNIPAAEVHEAAFLDTTQPCRTRSWRWLPLVCMMLEVSAHVMIWAEEERVNTYLPGPLCRNVSVYRSYRPWIGLRSYWSS